MSEDSLGVRMFEALATEDLARLGDLDESDDAVAVEAVLSAFDDAWQTSLTPATACSGPVGDCELIAAYESLRQRYTILPKLDARYHCTPPTAITRPVVVAPAKPLKDEQADALITSAAGMDSPVGPGTAGQVRQGVAVRLSKTVHVGDLNATVGENSVNTTRFASEIRPVGSESIVIVPQRESATGPGDAEPLGRLDLRFESINWTEARDLSNIGADPTTFLSPSRVIIVPINYAGAKPPTPEDQVRWAVANGVGGDPARFFRIVQPQRTHQKSPYFDVSCELPANREYMIYVEAGARADPKTPDRLHPTDPYDNFDVTFSSDTFMIAPDVSKAVAETLVLGGDFAKVTTRLSDGRVIPNGQVANTSNSAADKFPRLLGRAYAKYHPAVADLAASGAEASRTFEVTPGKHYIFSVYVSGIDGSNKIVIANGDQPVTISYGRDTVIYQGPNVYEREFFAASPYASSGPQTFGGASRYGSYYDYGGRTGYSGPARATPEGPHYRRVSRLSGTDVMLSSAVIRSPYEVVVKSDSPCDETATEWTKYVAEVDGQGTWYVSEWQKASAKDPFALLQRDRMEDEFDAREVIESYQQGPIKRLVVPFTAAGERVTVRFEDPDLDELRFDRIRVEAVE